MTIDYRTRNIVIAAALAAAAVLLTVLYVSSSRTHDETQTQSLTVYMSTRSYPLGTSGDKIAGNMKAVTVSRAAMTPQAVTSPDEIKGLYTTEPIYGGEQLTLKRFAPPAEQGVRARISGKQRAIQVSGDTNQLLGGTLVPGDRVDVVANIKNPNSQNDVRTFDALRNLVVLQTDKGQGGAKIDRSSTDDHSVILSATDEQAQRLYYVMKNGDWSLELRPPAGKKPRDSGRNATTFAAVVNGGTQ
jgi:Flp pilus assembly protein CpaB